jgi:hypothetical protein
MLLKRVLGLMAVLLLVVPLTAQAGADFQENYDDDEDGKAPLAPWTTIMGNGVWVEDAGSQRSAPYSLMVNNKGFGGADRGSSAPLGAEVAASDACPLILEYYVKYGSSRQQKKCDYYVVLSKGGQLPPDAGGSTPVAINCLAYCSPWKASSDFDKKVIWYFDGKKWGKAGYPGGGWNQAKMTITTDNMTLSQNGGGTVTRQYKGTFDTISIYTKNFKDKSWTSIDDVSVTGGIATVQAGLDILPSDDPNYFVPNKKSSGRLPMAILGSDVLDVTTIDFASVNILGVYPIKNKATYRDVNLDGWDDLELKFLRGDVIDAYGLDGYGPGDEVPITVSAQAGCDNIEATDVVVIQASGE